MKSKLIKWLDTTRHNWKNLLFVCVFDLGDALIEITLLHDIWEVTVTFLFAKCFIYWEDFYILCEFNVQYISLRYSATNLFLPILHSLNYFVIAWRQAHIERYKCILAGLSKNHHVLYDFDKQEVRIWEGLFHCAEKSFSHLICFLFLFFLFCCPLLYHTSLPFLSSLLASPCHCAPPLFSVFTFFSLACALYVSKVDRRAGKAIKGKQEQELADSDYLLVLDTGYWPNGHLYCSVKSRWSRSGFCLTWAILKVWVVEHLWVTPNKMHPISFQHVI